MPFVSKYTGYSRFLGFLGIIHHIFQISPHSDLILHSASTGALTSHSLTKITSFPGDIFPYQMNFPSFCPFFVSSASLPHLSLNPSCLLRSTSCFSSLS